MIHISLDSTGKILAAQPSLHEGLNVLGPLHGFANSKFELEPVSSPEQLHGMAPCKIDAAGPLVFVCKGKVAWAACDVTAIRDLFYAKNPKGNWALTDNFFHIAKEFPVLTFPKNIFLYFLSHGYLEPGTTFFKEIARVRAGMKLVFSGRVPHEQDAWETKETEPRTYETFKRAFSSVFEAYPFGEKAAISLSSGSDSGLVAAAAAIKYGKRPLALTIVTPKQPLAINDVDEANAQRVARHLGLEHAAVEFDYNNHHASELREAALAMPLAAHLSLHFFKLGKEAQKRGLTQVWHGQSADSVYNLGPTWKSWGGPLRRFYLIKEYWQGFPDVEGSKMTGKLARAAGAFGPLAWLAIHKQELRQPTSLRELIDAFAHAQGTPPFPRKHEKPMPPFSRKRTTRQAREELFDWKLQAFLTGKDAKVLYAMADHHGLTSVLPYTAANMLQFFRGLEMGLRDVFAPKRFIYRYLQEILGKSAYKTLYANQEKNVAGISLLTWTQWQKNVLGDTQLGQEMTEEAQKSGLPTRFHAERDWNACNFQHVLSAVWLQYVLSKLEGLGVRAEFSLR